MIPGVTSAATILESLPPADDVFARERYVEARIRRLAADASGKLAAALESFDHARLGCSAVRESVMLAAAAQVAVAGDVIHSSLAIAAELAQDPRPDVAAAAMARAAELADDAQLAAQLRITNSMAFRPRGDAMSNEPESSTRTL